MSGGVCGSPARPVASVGGDHSASVWQGLAAFAGAGYGRGRLDQSDANTMGRMPGAASLCRPSHVKGTSGRLPPTVGNVASGTHRSVPEAVLPRNLQTMVPDTFSHPPSLHLFFFRSVVEVDRGGSVLLLKRDAFLFPSGLDQVRAVEGT